MSEPELEELEEGRDVPPWEGGSEITQSQLQFLTLRHGRQDYTRILDALLEHNSITVIADP